MTDSVFTHDVFLTHNSKDKDVVRAVAERLRTDGLRVWFDDWEIRAGDSIPAKIEEGLEHSRVLVLCMSANAFGSDWAQVEAGTFRFRDPLNKERRFIPLRLDDAPIKGSLTQFLYINWFSEDREQSYAKLVEACRPQRSRLRRMHGPAREQFAEKVIQLDATARINVSSLPRQTMSMEPLTDIPESLKDDLRAPRIIPFIGAGVSMAVKDRQTGKALFPSGPKLLAHAAHRLRQQTKHPDAALVESLLLVNPPDYLDAVKRARQALGPVWYQFLKDELGHQKKRADDKSLELARAIWQLGSYLVITTNYDRVLRWAHPQPGDLSAWDIEAPAEQAAALREGAQRPTFWYLHGQIDNAARLILTPDGYSRLYPETADVANRYQAALKTLHSFLISKSFLFVGFSLNDVHFVRELQTIDKIFEGSTGPHYVLVREDDRNRVSALNLPVEIVTFPECGQPLLDLLRAMGESVRQGEQPPDTTPPGNVDPWDQKEPPEQPLLYRSGELYFTSKFIGREKEISDLLKFLRERRLVTLHATGGIGKTRLAIETVARLGNLNLSLLGPVPLEDVKEDSDSAVLAAFEAALGLDLERQGSEMAALLAKLQNKQGLLLIDNCETAPRALASLVDTLLKKTDIRILTTSQSPLGLLGAEQVFRLEPMQQPPKKRGLTLADLQNLDSFQLFQDRASLDSEWRPDDRDAPAIAEILRLTDGIPLALELVAAWTPYRALTQIAEQIRVTPFSQITAAEGHHDKRHSSLMRCFDWSFNRLPGFAQEGFACLGIFADTFTDEAVQAVCEQLDAQEVLTSLMKAALVRRLPGTRSRYTMLPITRAYANGKFCLLSSAHSMRQLFVSYFVRLVRQNRDFEDQDKRAILEGEWKNALAATHAAEKLEDWGAVCRLSQHMGEFLLRKGLWVQREHLNESALVAARRSNRTVAERCILVDLGTIYQRQGKWNAAEHKYKESLDIARRPGVRSIEGEVIALRRLGVLYESQGKRPQAEDVNLQLSRLPQRDDRQAITLDREGQRLERQWDLEEAEQKYLKSLGIREADGDEVGQAYSWTNLGSVFRRQRRWNEAEAAYERSRQLWQDENDRLRQAMVLQDLGELYQNQGRLDDAEEKYEESLKMRGDSDPKGKAVTLHSLGKIYRIKKLWRKAETVIMESLGISKQLPDLEGQSISYNQLGLVYGLQRRWAKALEAYNKALQIQENTNPKGQGISLERIGEIYCQQKRWSDAEGTYERSLLIFQQAKDGIKEGITFMKLALMRAAQGKKAEALEFVGKSVSVLEKQQYMDLDKAQALLTRLEKYMEEGQPWQLWQEVDFNARRMLVRNLVKAEREREQWEAAEQRYQRYSEECLDSGDWLGQAITLDELGSVYRKQERLSDAEAAHVQSLEIYNIHDLLDGQAMSHHKLGKLYSTRKWWPKAEAAYGESLRIKRAIRDDVGEVITLDRSSFGVPA